MSMTQGMPVIRQLPTSLINKIAAGEVIERPASVVKEMLENSVDAGATRIELMVEKGGVDLIRISDNGCGIAPEELHLAVASHATSKINSAEDLFDVHTLGFRGEALASIAEISHLSLKSRTELNDSAYELIVRGGEKEEQRPCSGPVGTTIEVRHLFFNTPVRRKFMKSPQTEMGHVVEAFTRIAIAYPDVHMLLESNGRTVYDCPPTTRWSERIQTFFGDEVADALIPVDSEEGDIRLVGFVGDPCVSRSNNRMQYLFLNGRHIRDRALQHALGEAYRGLMMVGRFPICFLRLQIPANDVDVNVHPTKAEVRFADSGRIYSQMLQTVRHKFLSSDLTAKVRHQPEEIHASFPVSTEVRTSTVFASPNPLPTPSAHTDSLLRWARGQESPPFQPFPDSGLSFSRQPNPTPTDHIIDNALANENGREIPLGTGQRQLRSDAPHPSPQRSHLGFQIHHRYLVTENEEGMVVVDQHALHERILYEQIRTKVLSERLETQRLLVPEPISLTPAERAAALDAKELLAKVGIEVEPFGGDTVIVTSYPAMLSKVSPSDMLRQVIEPLMASGKAPEARDLLDSLLHMISCKAAIKAGDRLTPEEITALLEQREHYADTHHCPHGRPTALYFSREHLDKLFKRT